jgi:hypothetical protein
MQPLSVANIDDLDQTTYISGGGTVLSVETDPPSFLIYAMQYVAGGQSTDDIVIRGDMGDNRKWTNPQERLPPTKAVVAFWGTLQRFQNHPLTNKSSTTCAVVAVHDITYLFNPGREKPTATTASDSTHVKGNLRERLRTRAEKQGSQSTSVASNSQTKLGKRKAASSEDEVDEDV